MMLGARTAAWAKSGYTAKDYVHVGLDNLFDGLETGGYGVHNIGKQPWYDLAQGTSIPVNNNMEMYDDGVGSHHRFAFPVIPIDFSDEFTFEVVIKVVGDGVTFIRGSTNSFPNIFHSGGSIVVRKTGAGGGDLAITPGSGYGVGYASVSKVDGVLTAHVRKNSIEATGSYSTSITIDTEQSFCDYNNFEDRLLCIRKYSRVLTEAERNHNLEIDKARFGLY